MKQNKEAVSANSNSKLNILSAFAVCVLSTSFSASASVAAAPNLCSGIFAEHSAWNSHGKFPNSSKPAVTLTQGEVVSRIDNLIELQLRLQKKSFNSENEFIQALAFFERETKGLMLLDPSYQQLYKDRFFEISQSLKKKQAKAGQLKRDDQRARNKDIKETIVFIPKEMFTIQHGDWIRSASFSPDGKYIVTASDDKTAKIYEIATRSEFFSILHIGKVKSASFSPDSKYVATASEDKKAMIYEVATKKKLFFIQHGDWVRSIAFSPDSKYVVTASRDETSKIYDLATHTELASIQHSNDVMGSLFSPDSKYVLTASDDKTAKIFEVSTQKEIHSIEHSKWLRGASFSPDGKSVVTASDDRTAKVTQLYESLGGE
jgi:WD40 repeat protein